MAGPGPRPGLLPLDACDPLRRPASGDFHLAPASPAIDAGLTLPEVPTDLEGNPRPQGAASDIGCYESGEQVFADGFESGTTAAWDQVAGE